MHNEAIKDEEDMKDVKFSIHSYDDVLYDDARQGMTLLFPHIFIFW